VRKTAIPPSERNNPKSELTDPMCKHKQTISCPHDTMFTLCGSLLQQVCQ